jgi:hypothetical protein
MLLRLGISNVSVNQLDALLGGARIRPVCRALAVSRPERSAIERRRPLILSRVTKCCGFASNLTEQS